MSANSVIDELRSVSLRSEVVVYLIGFAEDAIFAISEALSIAQWTAEWASQAQDQMAIALQKRYDFILIDLDGTEIYGPLLIDEIRSANGANAKSIVAATADFISDGFADQLRRAGVDHIFARPIQYDLVIQHLTEAIRIRYLKRR